MKEKNVQIPLKLMNDIIDFLTYLDLSDYDESVITDHDYILNSLIGKQAKLNLRKTYYRAVNAQTENERVIAGKRYLEHKHYLDNFLKNI